ncbi:invasion associated locus B family protein [Litoreibacter albidus]|uniref:Invasion protein IalB, involved in pathogenesis n=1 Tax=Litoreibacter albidus TaxID=670155 RepID=A0A1H2TGR0_9RHOB|nr:invasion associated locus B family protein [Litoreibacter albidus]SDW42464.1 Invasion protein IalB, involved in pathogenesis [Litoreibacter albidus]
MSEYFKTLMIGAALGAFVATGAIAQTATETPAEPAPAAEAPAADAPAAEAPAADAAAETDANRTDGLSTGSDVVEVGSTYKVSDHGDWELRCIKAPEGTKDPCQLYQLLEDQQGNSVAEINMFNLPSDDKLAAGATIVTPLETLLTQNVLLSVDGGKAKVYPFTFCTAIGCFSRVGFTAGDVASFKAGNEAKIVVVPAQAPDQKVELTMSLSGFTAGFAAVAAATAAE